MMEKAWSSLKLTKRIQWKLRRSSRVNSKILKILGGSFSQVIHSDLLEASFAYNSTKQLLYKIDPSTLKARVIFDDINYTAAPNRQFRVNSDQSYLFLLTKSNEISVLGGIEGEVVNCVSILKNIPGDKIIDFRTFGQDKVICLSKNGYLSCFKLIHNNSEMITVKKLYFEQNEMPNSLIASVNHNKICVSTLKLDSKQSSPKKALPERQEPEEELFSLVNIHVFEYDFVDNFFAMKFDKPFRIPKKYSDMSYDIEMSLSSSCTHSNYPILFMILNKTKSDCLSFVLAEFELKNFSSLKMKQRVSNFVFFGDSLWVLGKGGSVRVFV